MSVTRSDIGHNSGASRKAFYIAEIVRAVEARKAKRLQETLSKKELGGLSSSDRIIALKHGLLSNYQAIYEMHPNMDVLPGVVLFVSVFSDNGAGCCTYAMAKMATYFSRSERAIRDALKRAVECGALHRHKPDGGQYSHWPVVFRTILDPASSPCWFVDASLPIAPDTGSRLPVRQAAASEARRQGHRKPDDNVFPRENILEGETPVREKLPAQPKQTNGRQEMNLALGGESAYAENNITVSPSGKLIIGEEFRAELREVFSDQDIDDGVNSALAVMGTDRNKVRILQQVRRQCGFARRDNGKAAAFALRKPGVVRNGRPSL